MTSFLPVNVQRFKGPGFRQPGLRLNFFNKTAQYRRPVNNPLKAHLSDDQYQVLLRLAAKWLDQSSDQPDNEEKVQYLSKKVECLEKVLNLKQSQLQQLQEAQKVTEDIVASKELQKTIVGLNDVLDKLNDFYKNLKNKEGERDSDSSTQISELRNDLKTLFSNQKFDEFQEEFHILKCSVENWFKDVLNTIKEQQQTGKSQPQILNMRNEVLNMPLVQKLNAISAQIDKLDTSIKTENEQGLGNFVRTIPEHLENMESAIEGQKSSFERKLEAVLKEINDLQTKQDMQKESLDVQLENMGTAIESQNSGVVQKLDPLLVHMSDMFSRQDMQKENLSVHFEASLINIDDLRQLNFVRIELADPESQSKQYRVVLQQMSEPFYFILMYIPSAPGKSLENLLNDVQDEGRVIYKVWQNFFEQLGLKLERLILSDVRNGVYVATLEIRQIDGRLHLIEIRPSDAFNIALRLKAPLYINKNIMQLI